MYYKLTTSYNLLGENFAESCRQKSIRFKIVQHMSLFKFKARALHSQLAALEH